MLHPLAICSECGLELTPDGPLRAPCPAHPNARPYYLIVRDDVVRVAWWEKGPASCLT